MRVERTLEGDGDGELSIAIESPPGSHVGHRQDYEPEEGKSSENGQDDGDREITLPEVRAGLFRAFSYRLEARQKPGHYLPNQKHRNGRAVAEEWAKV